MVYSEKYLSQFIFDPYVHVLSERIEDLVFNSNISNYISSNTTVSRRIQIGAKLLAEDWQEIHCYKNIYIYTVFSKSAITLCFFGGEMLLLITEIFIKFIELILKIIIF